MTMTARVLSDKVSLKVLTREELRQLCKEQGLTDVRCDIVAYLVIDEMTNADVYRMLGYSKSRFFEIKRAIKQNPIFVGL